MPTFQCRLITPEAKMLDQPATSVVLPAWDGQMGFLADRAPIVGKLGVGELRMSFPDTHESRGGDRSYYIEDGFFHMVANKLTILAKNAVAAERLTETDARAELAEAEARNVDAAANQAEREAIREARSRAQTKLSIAQRFKERGSAI